jgi:hypothetical protein
VERFREPAKPHSIRFRSSERDISMGQDFAGSLTKPGVQVQDNAPQFFANPGEAAKFAAMNTKVETDVTPGVQPRMFKPTFQEATTDKAGNATLGSGLTKRGVLFGLLKGGLQGAVDALPSRNFNEGALFAQRAPIERQERNRRQVSQEIEDQLRQSQVQQAPVLFDLRRREAESNIAENDARRASLLSLSGKREKTAADVQAEKQAAAEASGYAKGSREYNQILFGTPLDPPKGDTSRSPYEDFRDGYPNTQEGRLQASKDFIARNRNPQTQAEKLEDMKAKAEIMAVDYLNNPDAGGDPDKAAKLLDADTLKAKGSKREKEVATLARFIRDRLQERRLIIKPNALDGLLP